MAANEIKFQWLPSDAKQKANLQASPAFKNILPSPANGNFRMEVGMTKALGQGAQSVLHSGCIRVVQMLQRSEKA